MIRVRLMSNDGAGVPRDILVGETDSVESVLIKEGIKFRDHQVLVNGGKADLDGPLSEGDRISVVPSKYAGA